MQKLKYPVCTEDAEYMRMRKSQNLARCWYNSNENAVRDALESTGLRWSRQATWGYRLFDFWCHTLGVAIEVDGPEHHKGRDGYRDEYNFRRSGIIVLRIRNQNEEDLRMALEALHWLPTWEERRKQLWIKRKPRTATKAPLTKLKESFHIRNEYLEAVLKTGSGQEVANKYLEMAGVVGEQRDLLG